MDEDEDLLEEHLSEARGRLHNASIDLLVTVGLFGTITSKWPEDVQRNFIRKIDTVTDELMRETEEFQDFAEAFDN